jgi:hypothetical protein
MSKSEVVMAVGGDWKERPALNRPLSYFEGECRSAAADRRGVSRSRIRGAADLHARGTRSRRFLMIEDDVIRGVRAAREAFGQKHHFNIRAMVADLQAQDLAGDWPVVSLPPRRPPSTRTPNKSLQPTGAAIPASPGSTSPEAAPAAER